MNKETIVLLFFITIMLSYLGKVYFHKNYLEVLKKQQIDLLMLLIDPFSNYLLKFEIFLPLLFRNKPKNNFLLKPYRYVQFLSIFFWLLMFILACYIGYVNRNKPGYIIQ